MTEDRLLSSKLRQRSPAARAFTLLELLVVIGIMGLLFSIGLPAFKGLNQSNLTVSVNRQLLDDLGYARMRAITERSDVYVVFVPTNIWTAFNTITDPNTRKRLTNLVTAQYSGYAILGTRTLGDQPGHATPHYLTEWRTRCPKAMSLLRQSSGCPPGRARMILTIGRTRSGHFRFRTSRRRRRGLLCPASALMRSAN